MKNETFSKVEHIFSALIRHRTWVVMAVAVLTAVMGWLASHVEVKTVFSDLLPKNRPYVAVNQQFKSPCGGSNMVSIMIEVKEGDILNLPVLAKIKKITEEAALIPGADPFQVTSLASKKLKEITATTEGIATNPLMGDSSFTCDKRIRSRLMSRILRLRRSRSTAISARACSCRLLISLSSCFSRRCASSRLSTFFF